MSNVFISYARSEDKFAKRLAAELKSVGIDVWVDDDHIRLGENWLLAIEKAIEAASAVLVVISPNSARSEWVHYELGLARANSKAIYPILVDGDFTDIPFLLTQYPILDARQEKYPYAVKELTDVLLSADVKQG